MTLRMYLRASAAALVAGLMVVGLSAAHAQEVTIRYWSFLDPNASNPRSKAQTQMIEAFEQKNPGVKVAVEVVHWSKIVPMLITAVGAGNAPDVALIHSSRMTKVIEAGSVIPLDKFADGMSDADKNDFLLPFKDYYEQNHLYSLPAEHRVESVLMYRKDYLKQVGWDHPPQTWDEVIKVGKALTNGNRWGFVWPLSRKDSAALVKVLQTLYWSEGGSFFNEDGTAAINSPAGIKIGKMIASLAREYKIMPTNAVGVEEGRTMAKSGAVALYVDGSQVFSTIKSGAGVGDNLSSAPLPRFDASKPAPLAIVAGQTLAIAKTSKHPDVAWKFIAYMVSPEAQAVSGKVGGNLPVRKSAFNDPWFKTDIAHELVAWRDYVLAGARPFETHEQSDYMNDSLALAYERILAGQASVEDALNDAAARFDRRAKR